MSANPAREKRPSLPREAKVLGLVSFLNDAASEMILPLMPAFIGGLGLGTWVLGLFEGLAESLTAVMKYLAGRYADRVKRVKPLIVLGYGLASLVRPLFGLCSGAASIITLRALDRVGKGLRTAPRDRLLASAAQSGDKGRVFGFHRAMDHAGAVVGPLTASLLLLAFDDPRDIFLWSAIPGLVTVIVVVWFVSERATVVATASVPLGAERASASKQAETNRNFRFFLLSMFLFTLGNSTDLLLVKRAMDLGLSAALAPALWVALHLSKTTFSIRGGALSDRVGRKTTILLGWMIYALCYLGFAFAAEAWQVLILLVIYGSYYGLCEGPEKALASDLMPEGRQGRTFGLYHMTVGLAALPASLIAGYFWDLEGYGAAFALGLGALMAMIASVVLAFGVKEKPIPRQTP